MAFQNEEDYLDNLLKSMSDSNSVSAGSDLLSTASEMMVPDTFINPIQDESVLDDSVYEQMLFNLEHGIPAETTATEEETNPMSNMFEKNDIQTLDEVTVGQVVDSTDFNYNDAIIDKQPVYEEMPVIEEAPVYEEMPIIEEVPVYEEAPVIEEVPVHEEAPVIEEAPVYEETPVIEKTPVYEETPIVEETVTDMAAAEQSYADDSEVDAYIQKVLMSDDTDMPDNTIIPDNTDISDNTKETAEETVEQEPETEYIDITDTKLESENDLIGMLDGIIDDVENEIQESEATKQQNAATAEEIHEPEDKVDFSDIQVDEELRELLGMEDESEQSDNNQDIEQLTEEDLLRLADMDFKADEPEEHGDNQITELLEADSEDDSLAGLKSMMSEVGLSVEEAGVLDETKQQQSDAMSDVPDLQDIKADKKAGKDKKPGLLQKILAIFKKNKNQGTDTEPVNENEQVLNELFDENGELLGDKVKPKKKGLFSKSNKKGPSKEGEAAGPSIDDLDDIEDISEIKKKPKKEKKKKEPKPKKEKKKKEAGPKVKKEKPPVNPADLIHIKPVAWIIMIIITAGITGYVYITVSLFAYNQAMDSATYYMVQKKYNFAYDAISGIETRNDEDTALKEQIVTIMYVQKHYNSYERFVKMNMMFNAIDSLIQGIAEYDEQYEKAVEIGVSTDLDIVRQQIVNALMQYGITENMARSYAQISDYQQYVYIIESYGGISRDSNN